MIIDRSLDVLYIFTDGSGNNRTKMNCGYGIVMIYKEHEKKVKSNQYINSTSARAEIYGVLNALKLVTNKNIPVILYCDNEYVVKAISEKWMYKWESEYWITKDGMRINHDLWKQVLVEVRKFPIETLTVRWCKGHTKDNEYNNLADKLAGEAAKSDVIIDDSIREVIKH